MGNYINVRRKGLLQKVIKGIYEVVIPLTIINTQYNSFKMQLFLFFKYILRRFSQLTSFSLYTINLIHEESMSLTNGIYKCIKSKKVMTKSCISEIT